jgi:hypothetical protein
MSHLLNGCSESQVITFLIELDVVATTASSKAMPQASFEVYGEAVLMVIVKGAAT